MTKQRTLKTPGPLPTSTKLKGKGPSMSDLVLQDRDAPVPEVIHLSQEDQEAFAKALLDPPPTAPALARALRRRQKRLKPG